MHATRSRTGSATTSDLSGKLRQHLGRQVNPIRFPTGELTGYIGITEARLPKEFHLSNVATFPEKIA
jgi:hypothetical protein